MSENPGAEFSALIWLLGAGVGALAVHLALGWARMAQRGPALLRQKAALALGAGALGTGLCSTLVLGLQAQALAFPVGHQALPTAGLWLAAMVGSLPVVALLALGAGPGTRAGLAAPAAPGVHPWRPWLVGLAALWLAVLSLALQAGWVWTAGFRPGVLWRWPWVAASATVLCVGLPLALWLALAPAVQASPRRVLWRGVATVAAALVLVVGQEAMTRAAGLETQRASGNQELPGTVLSLLCGVLVPLVMAAMALDLWLRRRQGRQGGDGGIQPPRRRRRRYRIRSL